MCISPKDLAAFVHQQAAALDGQLRVVKEQSTQIEELSITVEKQSALIQHLENENEVRLRCILGTFLREYHILSILYLLNRR